MFSRKKVIFFTLFNSVLVLLILVYLFTTCKQDKIVYVDNLKVFEQFNMSIEMKKTGSLGITSRKKIVDSLYNLIQSSTDIQRREILVKEFALQKEELENFGIRYSNEESAKIWSRIKGYAKDFSIDNNFEMLLGTQQGEYILFGTEKRDVSNEFIIYINEKYEGDK